MLQLAPYPPVTEELLREVVRRILSVGAPERIILFGSHARGDAHAHSDLDLLVIEASDRPRHERASEYLTILAGIYPDYDVVVWTPEEVAEWAGVRNAFITTVVREGRTLHA